MIKLTLVFYKFWMGVCNNTIGNKILDQNKYEYEIKIWVWNKKGERTQS